MFEDLLLQQGPFQPGGTVGNIISFIMFMSFLLFILYGQKIQMRMALYDISGRLKRLEFLRNEARGQCLKVIKDVGKPKDDPAPAINSLLEQFVIGPVDLDPAGIVWKIDHILDVRDSKFKDDVRRIAPAADEAQVNNLENVVEATLALNTIYRIVRHFYLLGKKTSSFIWIFQLQMLLPLIMQEAEALVGAVKAFSDGQPIGDGIGALVASRLMKNVPKRKIEKDMVMAETGHEGRKLIAVKAEGPGGNVGKPGDAIRKIIEENEGRVSMIVMIDAAVKFEGENTGELSEGIGAAIGGIGTEKFKIEEEALKYKIPVYAMVIKQSIQEAIMPMKKEICDAAEKVIDRIKQIVVERAKEGESIIVAGIGNTVGIAQ